MLPVDPGRPPSRRKTTATSLTPDVRSDENAGQPQKAARHAIYEDYAHSNSALFIYLHDISRYRRPSRTEEMEWAKQIQLGREAASELDRLLHISADDGADIVRKNDLEAAVERANNAKQMLVNSHLRCVVRIAKLYEGRGLPLLDLIQEGNAGLMKAADSFDQTRGYRFATYALHLVRGMISRAIVEQSRIIRLPAHLITEISKVQRVAREARQALLREPTEDELAQTLSMPIRRVRWLLNVARHCTSLDEPIEHGEASCLGDLIEDEDTITLEEEIERLMLKELVQQILSRLNSRQRAILEMRYGLKDNCPRAPEEIAGAFNITPGRVRQIERDSLYRLRVSTSGLPLHS